MAKKTVEDEMVRNLDVWFKRWTVTHEQEKRIKELRRFAYDFAYCVAETVDPGLERDLIFRHIRDAMLIARDAIATERAHGPA